MTLLRIFIFVLSLMALPAVAEEIYQEKEAFIAEVFGGNVPEASTFWIKKEMLPTVHKIMGHPYRILRTKYWREGGRTLWILEEIGKVKPITIGVVVAHDAIEQIKVLAYRESHGWEVRYPFFTDQFKGIALKPNHRLTDRIDNISGATMSVDALTNVSRLALFFHQRVIEK